MTPPQKKTWEEFFNVNWGKKRLFKQLLVVDFNAEGLPSRNIIQPNCRLSPLKAA